MSKVMSVIRTEVRQMLRDEYESGEDLEFQPGEIDQAILRALVEVSKVSPYLVKETLTTTADSKELSITTIRDDLLFISHIEFKTGKYPQDFRNFTLFGDTLTMDIDWDPEDSEDVYLYCGKVHTLTEESSTLWPQQEKVLMDGAAAYTAQNWLNKGRTEIKEAITAILLVNSGVDEVAARVTQSVTDLASARAKIVAKATEINTAIGNMSARITAAIGDLTSGRTYMGAGASSQLADAITDITAARTEMVLAVADLATGRGIVGNLQVTADTAMDTMAARVTQAIADVASARALVNTITKGRNAVGQYASTANGELNAAMAKLTEANGFLGQSIEGDRYRMLASAEIQSANGYMAEAISLLKTSPTAAYGTYAARELQNANSYLNQARGYLAHDSVGRDYMSLATREISTAQASLAKSRGYAQEATLRLQNVRALGTYINWVNTKLVEFNRGLASINQPRVFKEYSNS